LREGLASTYYAIAVAQFDQGDLAEGEKALDRAQQVYESLDRGQPDPGTFQTALHYIAVTRGGLYWRSGRFTEGHRLWSEGLKGLEAAHVREPANSLVTARLAGALDKIATSWAAVGCWGEAADLWERTVDQDANYEWSWYNVAGALALAKDSGRYRRQCERMLAHFGESRDPNLAERTAKACLLLPDGTLLRSATDLAERSVRLGSGHIHFYLLVQGLAQYRNGAFTAARETLENIPVQFPDAKNNWAAEIPRKLVLAMALSRLGEADAAQRLFADAQRDHDHRRSRFSVVVRQGWDLHNGLICYCLLKEAHETIKKLPLNESLTRAVRRYIYNQLGEQQKAVAQAGDQPRTTTECMERGSSLASLGFTEEALTDFANAIQREPGLAAAFLARARCYVANRQWDKAVPDLAAFVARRNDGEVNFHLPPLLIQTGDLDGHRRYCKKLLVQYRETTDPWMAERTAKVCLIVPPPDSMREAALSMADRAISLDPHNWVSCFIQFVKALAEYRRENYREALEWSRKAAEDKGIARFLKVQIACVRTMALARLNETEAARSVLAETTKLFDQEWRRFERPGDNAAWHDWLICRTLLAEANEVVLPP
jgi:tetratricopeptide (TPR) repeat protein